MRLITNSGGDRVVDELRRCLATQGTLDVASGCFSLFAFAEVQDLVDRLGKCRLVLPAGEAIDLLLLGGPSDRAHRNRLLGRWLASQCAAWIESKVEIKSVPVGLPQSMLVVGDGDGATHRVISGNCPFTTDGLGLTPGKQFSLIQAAETPAECTLLSTWFTGLWEQPARFTGTQACPAGAA